MSGKAYTEDERAVALDLRYSAREAAELLGRSTASITTQRYNVNHGIYKGERVRFSDEEDTFIRNTPHLPAWAVARELGRSVPAIHHRRKKIGAPASHTGQTVNAAINPCSVGDRSLVARTCYQCGLLLDASWFGYIGPRGGRSGHWWTRCAACCSERSAAHVRESGYGRARSEVLAALTVPTAEKRREPYTDSDHKVLADPGLTILEKAVQLGRTYSGIQSALSDYGYSARQSRRPDPRDVQWIISLPDEVA
jgi:hypothetical protein